MSILNCIARQQAGTTLFALYVIMSIKNLFHFTLLLGIAVGQIQRTYHSWCNVQSSDFLVIANLLCLFLHQFCDVVGQNYEMREGLKANKHAWTIWQGHRVKTMVGIVYIPCGSSSLIPLLPYQTSGPGPCSVLYEPYLAAYVESLHPFPLCGLCCQLLFT